MNTPIEGDQPSRGPPQYPHKETIVIYTIGTTIDRPKKHTELETYHASLPFPHHDSWP